MVRRRLITGAAALLALFGARPAAAGPITFTGDVEKDFAAGPGVVKVVNHPYASTVNSDNPISDPSTVYQASYMTAAGRINGWVFKDVRAYYDKSTDSLQVGINFFGIAGDADGNGVVGTTDPRFGGVEHAHLGVFNDGKNGRPLTDESITVGFGFGSKTPTFVAGIPGDHSIVGPGTDGFSVNWAKNTGAGLSMAYGASLNAHNGNLAFEPDAAHPDFEFTIRDFSKIPGFDPAKGFYISAFAGASDDVDVGEDSLPSTLLAPQTIPEPATMLAWSAVMLGGTAVRKLRRRGASRA